MKQKGGLAVVCGLLLLTLTACGAGGSQPMAGGERSTSETDSETAMGIEKGNRGALAPDFEMEDLKGNTVNLSDFAGEKVYLKYWASRCPICLGGLEHQHPFRRRRRVPGSDHRGARP